MNIKKKISDAKYYHNFNRCPIHLNPELAMVVVHFPDRCTSAEVGLPLAKTEVRAAPVFACGHHSHNMVTDDVNRLQNHL